MSLTKRKNLLFIIGMTLGSLTIISFFVYALAIAPRQKTEDWQDFKTYTSSFRLPSHDFMYENQYTTGCFKDDAGYPYVYTCTFNSNQFYGLSGNYKDNALQLLAILRQRGFDFKDDGSKSNFEGHINNKNIAGDLSNATPLSVNFTNKSGDVVVAMEIGDKKRLNTRGPTGLPLEMYNTISDQQLLAILSFSKEYK